MPGGVLLDGDEARHAAALVVGAAHEVAGALGGDHDHVDAGRRHDPAEADVEAVGEEQGVAVVEVRGDVVLVDRLLLGVGQQDHDHVGLGGGLGDRQHLQARRPRPWPSRTSPRAGRRRTSMPESLQVQRVGVALRAVADDRDLAVGDERPVGVLLVVDVGHGIAPVSDAIVVGEAAQAPAVRRRRRRASSSCGWPAPDREGHPAGALQGHDAVGPRSSSKSSSWPGAPSSETVMLVEPTPSTSALEHADQLDDLAPGLGRRRRP